MLEIASLNIFLKDLEGKVHKHPGVKRYKILSGSEMWRR